MATISEEELEDYLFTRAENHNPMDIEGKCFRQVNLTGYGIMDLVYVSFEPNIYSKNPEVQINIVELKKGVIDLAALGQLCRYKIGLERCLSQITEQINAESEGKFELTYTVEGTLIGSNYASGDIPYVIDTIDWLSCYHYALDLEKGITLEHSEGWYHTKENLDCLEKFKKLLFSRYYRQWLGSKKSPTPLKDLEFGKVFEEVFEK